MAPSHVSGAGNRRELKAVPYTENAAFPIEKRSRRRPLNLFHFRRRSILSLSQAMEPSGFTLKHRSGFRVRWFRANLHLRRQLWRRLDGVDQQTGAWIGRHPS
jgi:hypothetical protein